MAPPVQSMQVDSTSGKRSSSSLNEATPAKTIKAKGKGNKSKNMPETGTGKEQADGGADSMGMELYHIEKPLSLFDNRDNVYRKVHKFMTFGLAPNIMISTGATTGSQCFLSTYLAEIPWHLPALYMTPGEFANLDHGATVKSVSLEVYYRGSTIQFETAATTTGLATLNQINDIAVAHALNKTGQGSNVSFTKFSSTQSMIPTTCDKPKYDTVITGTPPAVVYRGMLMDYYGTNNDDANFTNYIPHHQAGRQTFLYNYWAQTAMQNTTALPTRNQFGGWPMLADKIEQIDGKTAVNQCVMTAHYVPKMAPLTTPLVNLGHGIPYPNSQNNFTIPIAGNLPAARILGATPTGSDTPTATTGQQLVITETSQNYDNQTSGTGEQSVPTFTLYTPIEKSQFARTGAWGQMDCHVQPSCHIGIQPVPSLTTSATLNSSVGDGTWTDVRGYWEVIATMHTKEHDPTAYPWSIIPNVPVGDVIYFNPTIPAVNIDPRSDGATWQGLYTTQIPVLPTPTL